MLQKPSGGVPHMGGVPMRRGEPYYEMLREWIAAGVKLDLDSPRVAKIEVFPQRPQIPLPGMKQQVIITATYADGMVRDVTADAFLESSLTDVIEVDKQGLATGMRRGESSLLARYEGAYAATTVVVMGDRSGFAWQDPPANNHLDLLVYKKLKKLKVLPSEQATDAEFLRRIYLDLIGVPPSADSVRVPLCADARDTKVKRDEMIDRLIGVTRIRRTLDQQMGRPVAGESQVPGRGRGLGVPQLDVRQGGVVRTTCPTTSSPIAC